MMKSPKEVAQELVDMFAPIMPNENWRDRAIDCALVAIAFAKNSPLNTDGYNKYLEEVKTEIEDLL